MESVPVNSEHTERPSRCDTSQRQQKTLERTDLTYFLLTIQFYMRAFVLLFTVPSILYYNMHAIE